jgi:ABC-type glutathione transport system ATPase component
MPIDGRPILQVEQLEVRYGHGSSARTALHGVDLSVMPGESVGVVGETGSGKSTLARAIVGLVAPTAGRIFVAGEETTRFSASAWRAFRRKGVAQYVFQDPLQSLDPDMTIAASVAEPLLVRGEPRQAARTRALDALARTKLDPCLADRCPSELSGGQRQRAALARALVGEPRLLVLDEPVSALDAATRVHVLEFLAALRAAGTTMLFISHDLGSVAALTDRTIVLYRGAIVEAGRSREIVTRPRHPYTRLLVGSAPTRTGTPLSPEMRRALRAELSAHPSDRP